MAERTSSQHDWDAEQGKESAPIPVDHQNQECYDVEGSETSSAGDSSWCLPDEVALLIFGYLTEKDLRSLSRVSKRFNWIACHNCLWKRIYRNVFEYDLPLFNPAPCVFEFRQPDESGVANPWKESFRRFRKGIHVYGTGIQPTVHQHRLTRFSELDIAVEYAHRLHCDPDCPPVIFIHAGHHFVYCTTSALTIRKDIALIGAASGDIAEQVTVHFDCIVFASSEITAITIRASTRSVYIGHLSMTYTPRTNTGRIFTFVSISSTGQRLNAIIEHCNIINLAKETGHLKRKTGVRVVGMEAHAVIRQCHIKDCEHGILIHNANGIYEGNIIATTILADKY